MYAHFIPYVYNAWHKSQARTNDEPLDPFFLFSCFFSVRLIQLLDAYLSHTCINSRSCDISRIPGYTVTNNSRSHDETICIWPISKGSPGALDLFFFWKLLLFYFPEIEIVGKHSQMVEIVRLFSSRRLSYVYYRKKKRGSSVGSTLASWANNRGTAILRDIATITQKGGWSILMGIMTGEVSRVSLPVFRFLAPLWTKKKFISSCFFSLSFSCAYMQIISSPSICAFFFRIDIILRSAPPPSFHTHVRPSGNSLHNTEPAVELFLFIPPKLFKLLIMSGKIKWLFIISLLLPLCRLVMFCRHALGKGATGGER